jgi:hypothetical protein
MPALSGVDPVTGSSHACRHMHCKCVPVEIIDVQGYAPRLSVDIKEIFGAIVQSRPSCFESLRLGLGLGLGLGLELGIRWASTGSTANMSNCHLEIFVFPNLVRGMHARWFVPCNDLRSPLCLYTMSVRENLLNILISPPR